MTDTVVEAVPTAVEITRRENCFKGFYRLDRVHLRHELFTGGMGREISRELFVRHDAVCVLPYDPHRDEVVLIEQFRVGALGNQVMGDRVVSGSGLSEVSKAHSSGTSHTTARMTAPTMLATFGKVHDVLIRRPPSGRRTV